jgi:hypothetical protein
VSHGQLPRRPEFFPRMRYRARKRRERRARVIWWHENVRYRVHARPFDGDEGTMIAGEWQDGPIPDFGTIARMASDLLLDAHDEMLDVS